MLVLLYSTDMLLKSSIPWLVISLISVSTLVRLRSSSGVPFINHSTLVIVVPDWEAQFNVGSRPPGTKTLPLEELSNTRNQIVHKTMLHNIVSYYVLFNYQFPIYSIHDRHVNYSTLDSKHPPPGGQKGLYSSYSNYTSFKGEREEEATTYMKRNSERLQIHAKVKGSHLLCMASYAWN